MAPAAPARVLSAVTGVFTGGYTKVKEWRRTRRATGKSSLSPLVLALLASIIVLFTLVTLSVRYSYTATKPGTQISLTELRQLEKGGRIATATFRDEDAILTGTIAGPSVLSTYEESQLFPGGGTFWMPYPSQGSLTASLTQQLIDSKVTVNTDHQTGKGRIKFISTFLFPVLILANLFALLISAGKGSGSAIGGVINFGSLDDSRTGESATTFKDVGGADEAVVELAEVRDYLTNPAKYKSLGAAPPKGVMLFGPPGTGKTLLAKAVAGEAGVPFFSVAGAQFVESLVGVGAARVRDLFKRVRAVSPAILFIDEIDAVGRKRGAGGGSGGSDEREQTLNQLLVEMDGFDVQSGVVVIAATNRPDILDPALMRPGRFDRHITVERPDVDGREIILKIHARNKPMGSDVDIADIAHRTPGFTGADLASVVNEAALLTIRGGRLEITTSEFDEAIDRVLSGPRRRGRIMSEEETYRSAIHETGHAVVSAALGHVEDVHRVSILPRGRSIATTTLTADEAVLTRSVMEDRLAALMAGAAAERLIFGEVSTGIEGDLDQATDMARDMAARYGMSDLLGPVRLLAKPGAGFLGDAPPVGDLSPAQQEALDAEVRRLIVEAEETAFQLLQAHRPALESVARYLQEHETVEGEPLHDLLRVITEPAPKTPTQRTVKIGGSGKGAAKAATVNGAARKSTARTSA